MRSQKVFQSKVIKTSQKYTAIIKSKKTNSEDEKGLANLADYHEKRPRKTNCGRDKGMGCDGRTLDDSQYDCEE